MSVGSEQLGSSGDQTVDQSFDAVPGIANDL